MRLRIVLFGVFYFSFYTASFSQVNDATRQNETQERDSLMAVSILNLDSDFVFVQGGTFEMGLPDTSGVEGGDVDKPRHKVTVKSFYILRTPVTQALWFSVMDTNPSVHKNCYTCPVENVSWYDAQKFITKLNKLYKGHYRLPTEAEYEYAARGGNKSRGFSYSGSNNENEVAWYADNSGDRSHRVAQKMPNELGLYDMSGDIWEWCSDWYAMYYYKISPPDNPQGPSSGEKKSLRGGTWLSLDEGCMVTSRGSMKPASKDRFAGFRIVRDP